MLIYVGRSWVPGIPARDLTDAEAEEYGRARLLGTGLYIATNTAPDAPVKVRKVKSHRNWKQAVEDTAEVKENGRD